MEGEWTPYTGDYINKNNTKLYKNSSELQIDHTVPLKNAYICGACKWTEEQRNVYANDRTPGHLSIMVNYLNTEKGDNTPYKWLPPVNELRYITVPYISKRTNLSETIFTILTVFTVKMIICSLVYMLTFSFEL